MTFILMKTENYNISEANKEHIKHIEVKNEKMKMKDTELVNLDDELKEERSKLVSLSIKTMDLEEKLKMKELEVENIKLKINKECTEFMEKQRNILNEERGKFELQLAEKDEELCEMTKMFLERQEKVKSVQISLEEVKEKFRLEYQQVVSEKDKMGFVLKEQEENFRNLFEMENVEILNLKNELEKTEQKEMKPTDFRINIEEENYAEQNSEKRLTNIVKALEYNNSKLVQEVASLKDQLSMNANRSIVKKILDKPTEEDGKVSKQKTDLLRDKILNLTSDNSKLKQNLLMQTKLFEEAARDRDYFKSRCEK